MTTDTASREAFEETVAIEYPGLSLGSYYDNDLRRDVYDCPFADGMFSGWQLCAAHLAQQAAHS